MKRKWLKNENLRFNENLFMAIYTHLKFLSLFNINFLIHTQKSNTYTGSTTISQFFVCMLSGFENEKRMRKPNDDANTQSDDILMNTTV